jgi:hypothetical protein
VPSLAHDSSRQVALVLTLVFTAPNLLILVKVCFGIADTALTGPDLTALSKTYDIRVINLDPAISAADYSAGNSLAIDFDLNKVHVSNITDSDTSSINLYSDSLGALDTVSSWIPSVDRVTGKGTISATPLGSGRYVVAYKP